MTAIKRINSFLSGIFMILVSISFALVPMKAMPVITTILALSLFIYGIRMFIYFFALARHMTGGLIVLYRAAIVFDLGLFALKLPEFPLIYVMIYLAVIYGFGGVSGVLRALEAKRLEAPSWKLNFFHGLLSTCTAVLCLLFFRSISIAVMIYSAGMFYSGVIYIIQAFRETVSVYVQ